MIRKKYTRNFERSKWSDMIMMTDKDLIAKGVSAQGARTKVRIFTASGAHLSRRISVLEGLL